MKVSVMDGQPPPVPATPSRLLDIVLHGNVLAQDCPSRAVLQHLTSRWGVLVLLALQGGTQRFSQLRRGIGGVSERMLAQTLKQLEDDGILSRRAHDVVPPHVDYTLTPLGQEAATHIRQLTDWIEDSIGQILAHRRSTERDPG